ncbi:prolipoprotein diacylglyceryl transferase [candidate division KSB1 bacterium]|nr:prolipoprotein diacylglyceryl transferase [candidate division KSB1 bacterium]RQW07791.1 MAG: prolipoprotein diacylglyceryl transferase [candidate division KSB1 bacterium]
MTWWQRLPEKMNPEIFSLGPFQLRWYGMMYVMAFSIVFVLVMYRYRVEGVLINKKATQDWFGLAILGVLLGGRLGYVLFYESDMIFTNPLGILLPFELKDGLRYTGFAGMSFHGGVIGVILLSLFHCQRHKINFWDMADLVVPAIPLGYTFGRLGNFINGELYGRVTQRPWGMYFPTDMAHLRHPSQLYEAFFEGIVLFIILWGLRRQPILSRLFLPLYLIGYGVARFFIEFFREPDAHLGAVLGPLSMGQLLCIAMVLAGAALIPIVKSAASE